MPHRIRRDPGHPLTSPDLTGHFMGPHGHSLPRILSRNVNGTSESYLLNLFFIRAALALLFFCLPLASLCFAPLLFFLSLSPLLSSPLLSLPLFALCFSHSPLLCLFELHCSFHVIPSLPPSLTQLMGPSVIIQLHPSLSLLAYTGSHDRGTLQRTREK